MAGDVGRSGFERHGDATISSDESAANFSVVSNRVIPLGAQLRISSVTAKLPARPIIVAIWWPPSRRCHAKVLSVDPSEALKIPGVIGYVDHRDIPAGGSNRPGNSTCLDDSVFAENEVTSVGQTIGAIIAEDSMTARRAAQIVKVEYEDLPAILTLEDAIAKNSFMGTEPVVLSVGNDVETALKESELTLSKEVTMGGQEHMYMETQSALAIPGEDKNWEIFVATQGVKDCQEDVAKILGVPFNRIVIKCTRVGGGFGGKHGSQSSRALWPAVIAAEKIRRPVKLVLSRKEDLIATGKRHPMLGRFKVGFTREGKMNALDAELYLDGGHTIDHSLLVLFVSTMHFGLSYCLSAARLTGRACRTNLPSNTAFRGFGVPQGNYLIEKVMDAVADHLKLSPEKVREMNFAKPGDTTIAKDVLPLDDNMARCWNECLGMSQFQARKKDTEPVAKAWNFNFAPSMGPRNEWKFFRAVLVHIYLDGSILLAHGGIEMGQGLNSKVLQCASRALRVPLEQFTILDNSTDKVPNSVCTGGSHGSDVHGLAAKIACETLLQRLEPYMEKNPKGNWADWVKAAYEDRVGLSVTGIGKPVIPEGKAPNGFRYCVCGAACTEVEIDCLTGEHEVLQTDIVIDVGDSLNPAIDIGQIEGGFIQGYGLYTYEELLYSPESGQLLTDSVGKYKIPSVSTIPRNFRVALLKGSPEKHNVYSSRGIGEPPLLLGLTGYMAILEAVRAARSEGGLGSPEHFESPATPEKIRLACQDRFTLLAPS